MTIEIYADDLKKNDVLFNQQFYALSLIAIKDEKVLLLYLEDDKTYSFPQIAYSRENEQPLALNSLTRAAGVEPQSLVKSVTVIEHFSKRTYIHHYFKIVSAIDVFSQLKNVKGKPVWLKDYEALETLGEYHGDDPWGQQKMEREFIALFNSI
ncbi:MAG: hypothetical protein WC251_04815 [Candidatus Izemoplasmatales bacterium]|jgi:hypothetical protein